jgi:predicted phosphodiesterase
MRIAVLSDIHSNLAALNAVREDLPSVEEIWVLGDIVGYGPQPNEVIRTLQELGARSVLGNHDGAAIGMVDPDDFNPDAKTAVQWTATQLDPNARTYLATLPEIRVSGDLTAVHGSPREPIWEYITSPAVAAANLGSFRTWLCLFGHTHVPAIFRASDGRVEPIRAQAGDPVRLDARRALINPGSVGQPRDGIPESAYAILDDREATVEFHRVAYDIGETQRLMYAAELPPRLAERLAWGR